MKTEHPTFDKVDNVAYKIFRYISYAATAFLFLTMMTAVINVILEKLHKLGVPVSGINDTVNWIKYMNICVVYLCTGYITLERGQSGVDLLTRRYPPAVQKILGILAYVSGTVVIAYISYLGYTKVVISHIEKNVRINDTIASSFPQWPFSLLYAIGMALLSFSCLWAVIRILFGKKPAQDAIDPEEENAKSVKEPSGLEEKQ